MDNPSFLVLVVIFLGVVLVIDYFRAQGNKQRISLYLHSKDASNVVVYLILLSGDRSNHVYDVEYTDRQGQQRQVQCKVNRGWFSDGEIFWSIPPEV